jgi:hypothetical protein
LGAVIILVVVFFVAGLGIMIRTEMKTVERRDVHPFGLSAKKNRRRELDGTYILK